MCARGNIEHTDKGTEYSNRAKEIGERSMKIYAQMCAGGKFHHAQCAIVNSEVKNMFISDITLC